MTWSFARSVAGAIGFLPIFLAAWPSSAQHAKSFADDAPVVALIRFLAEQGDPEAQNRLGDIFSEGRGAAKDYSQALLWYQKAADQGFAPAEFSLAVAYFSGQGAPQDNRAAVTWYRKAAEQGYADAEANLASLYEHGWGVSQNFWEAANWYRKAADQGDASSQFSLAQLYAKGLGVKHDDVLAYMWLAIAASDAPKTDGTRELALRYKDDLAKRLSSAEIMQAQDMAKRWKKDK